MQYVAVRSDHVQALAYDPDTKTLGVIFSDGSEYLCKLPRPEGRGFVT